MAVWADWATTRQDTGWPRESCEVRAFAAAQQAARLDGIARWRHDREPPATPRETRPAAATRIPRIDRARTGPAVDRLLLDLEAMRGQVHADALRLAALAPRTSVAARAEALRVSDRAYYRARKAGLRWLEHAWHTVNS